MAFNQILEQATETPVAIALVAITLTIVYYLFKSRGLPPGPTGVPLLGYWPFLDSVTGHLKLDDLKKKYGDVYSFFCTGTLYINLGTHKAIREAQVTKSDCFAARMANFSVLTEVFEGGVAFAKGEEWKNFRKFFLQVFKERLSVKYNTLDSVYDSMKSMVDKIKSMKGEPVNIIDLMTDECTTILRLTLFGAIGTTDEKIREINDVYAIVIQSMSSLNTLLTGNIAKYLILPCKKEYRVSKKSFVKVKELIYKLIDEHKATYNAEHIRDIIDEYIKEKKDREMKGDPTAKYFTDKALMASLLQFMGDGVLAVGMFIGMFLKVLLDHPEEQEKIYKELMEVVGSDRQPTVDDKSKLIYLNAFVLEALRMSDFFPFFPTLECTKETTLHGYRIPKGAVTLMNIWSAHFDPVSYENPEKFDPTRFISKDGKKKPEMPITFGMGKRSCLGEGYVMLQVFLAVATVLKNFHLASPEDSSLSTFEVLMSGKVFISAKPRHE